MSIETKSGALSLNTATIIFLRLVFVGSSVSKELLIIDDDPVVRHLLGAILKGAGYNVSSCESGAEAISLLSDKATKNELPDLVFLDLQLNDMPGTDVLIRLRELSSDDHVPTVMLSANKKEEILRDHPDAEKADGFLEKPFPPDTVIAAISELLGD